MPTEGLKQSDVEQVREQIDKAMGATVSGLHKIESAAQQRLHEATVERQQLDMFIDELHYRLQFLSQSREGGAAPVTVTGPLTEEQLGTMQRQEEGLLQRKEDLRKTSTDLEQLTTRVAWLIHQIEGASSWVLATPASEGEIEANRAVPSTPGEQVMWAQIITGQEAERARLAREIHDGPAQVLANTVMRLQFVEQMYRHHPDEVQSELARVRSTLQESLRDVRRFMFNLRPASLADVGLLPTLKQYTSDYIEQFGVPVELSAPENLTLSGNQELAVFRIIQEALQNIHKHAEATKVEVDIQQRPSGPLVVSITDNGKGFDPKLARQRRPSSSGLVSMKERAATVGATLNIDSKPGIGTTITLTVPMPKARSGG